MITFFIIQGLVQRQLALRKPLFICFVDFSKAFDLVNRNLLFFKLMKQGFHGRVIDTLRSLYRQTFFCVKCNGKISPKIRDELGVNQGGNASSTFFRSTSQILGTIYLNMLVYVYRRKSSPIYCGPMILCFCLTARRAYKSNLTVYCNFVQKTLWLLMKRKPK